MKFTKLEEAWLDELGVLPVIGDMIKSERASWTTRAQSAEQRVRATFRETHDKRRMKDVTQAYKLHRQTQEKPMTWPAFAPAQHIKMIRAFARQQIDRARRGKAVE